MTVKQALGRVVFRAMPVSRHVFDHFRLELNALWVRILHRTSPRYRARIHDLRGRRDLLVNLGCGPFGRATGWINLDLAPIENVFLRTDCRRWLPMADYSCLGVHVEMFLEHLDPVDEVPGFLREVHRCLQGNGVARFVVPDAALFIRAYLSPGWDSMNEISYGSEDWSRLYSCKMDALNHVFQQGYEHYGGWDVDRLGRVLLAAGFSSVERRAFGTGEFPGGPIDREYHRTNGLYVEARK
jgi:predicted SAM-dependent methyltransferase